MTLQDQSVYSCPISFELSSLPGEGIVACSTMVDRTSKKKDCCFAGVVWSLFVTELQSIKEGEPMRSVKIVVRAKNCRREEEGAIISDFLF